MEDSHAEEHLHPSHRFSAEEKIQAFPTIRLYKRDGWLGMAR